MGDSKFNTTQYQNVIGGGTEKWINMSDDDRKALREGIATNLNIGLTLSPFGGGAAGAMNLVKVIGASIRNPKNAFLLAKGLLNTGKNYIKKPKNIGKKALQKGVFSSIDENPNQIETIEVSENKTNTRTNNNPLNVPKNAP